MAGEILEGVNWDLWFLLAGIAFFLWLELFNSKLIRERVQKRTEAATSSDLKVLRQDNEFLKTERAAVKEELIDIRASLEEAKPFQHQAENLKSRIREMERVWLDPSSSEKDCVSLLVENDWVLWPDYDVRENLKTERSISNAMKELFPSISLKPSSYANLIQDKNLRIDAFGWSYVAASIQPSLVSGEEKLILLIEFKAPNIIIGEAAMQQAYAYATDVMAQASDQLWGKRIDCLVIGGKVKPGISDGYIRLSSHAHGAVRIIPLDYQTLINRAKVIVESFV